MRFVRSPRRLLLLLSRASGQLASCVCVRERTKESKAERAECAVLLAQRELERAYSTISAFLSLVVACKRQV